MPSGGGRTRRLLPSSFLMGERGSFLLVVNLDELDRPTFRIVFLFSPHFKQNKNET
jgi:hypothetical protein